MKIEAGPQFPSLLEAPHRGDESGVPPIKKRFVGSMDDVNQVLKGLTPEQVQIALSVLAERQDPAVANAEPLPDPKVSLHLEPQLVLTDKQDSIKAKFRKKMGDVVLNEDSTIGKKVSKIVPFIRRRIDKRVDIANPMSTEINRFPRLPTILLLEALIKHDLEEGPEKVEFSKNTGNLFDPGAISWQTAMRRPYRQTNLSIDDELKEAETATFPLTDLWNIMHGTYRNDIPFASFTLLGSEKEILKRQNEEWAQNDLAAIQAVRANPNHPGQGLVDGMYDALVEHSTHSGEQLTYIICDKVMTHDQLTGYLKAMSEEAEGVNNKLGVQERKGAKEFNYQTYLAMAKRVAVAIADLDPEFSPNFDLSNFYEDFPLTGHEKVPPVLRDLVYMLNEAVNYTGPEQIKEYLGDNKGVTLPELHFFGEIYEWMGKKFEEYVTRKGSISKDELVEYQSTLNKLGLEKKIGVGVLNANYAAVGFSYPDSDSLPKEAVGMYLKVTDEVKESLKTTAKAGESLIFYGRSNLPKIRVLANPPFDSDQIWRAEQKKPGTGRKSQKTEIVDQADMGGVVTINANRVKYSTEGFLQILHIGNSYSQLPETNYRQQGDIYLTSLSAAQIGLPVALIGVTSQEDGEYVPVGGYQNLSVDKIPTNPTKTADAKTKKDVIATVLQQTPIKIVDKKIDQASRRLQEFRLGFFDLELGSEETHEKNGEAQKDSERYSAKMRTQDVLTMWAYANSFLWPKESGMFQIENIGDCLRRSVAQNPQDVSPELVRQIKAIPSTDKMDAKTSTRVSSDLLDLVKASPSLVIGPSTVDGFRMSIFMGNYRALARSYHHQEDPAKVPFGVMHLAVGQISELLQKYQQSDEPLLKELQKGFEDIYKLVPGALQITLIRGICRNPRLVMPLNHELAYHDFSQCEVRLFQRIEKATHDLSSGIPGFDEELNERSRGLTDYIFSAKIT